MCDLVLSISVVVHHPDLFCAGTIADEYDLAFSHAGNSAAKAKDDLVGETMCNQARVVGRRIFAILLAQNLRRDRVLNVVQPAVHRDLSAADSEIAECQHGGVGGGITPGVNLHILRTARSIEGIEA